VKTKHSNLEHQINRAAEVVAPDMVEIANHVLEAKDLPQLTPAQANWLEPVIAGGIRAAFRLALERAEKGMANGRRRVSR